MYHLFSHNDLDGVGCGIIAKLALGNQVSVSYNSIARLNHSVAHFLENATGNETLIITDLSVNEDNEKKINEYVAGGGKALLIEKAKGDWEIKVNQKPLETDFPTFEAAEKYLKKEYFATLVRDKDWIDHLMGFSPYKK